MIILFSHYGFPRIFPGLYQDFPFFPDFHQTFRFLHRMDFLLLTISWLLSCSNFFSGLDIFSRLFRIFLKSLDFFGLSVNSVRELGLLSIYHGNSCFSKNDSMANFETYFHYFILFCILSAGPHVLIILKDGPICFYSIENH